MRTPRRALFALTALLLLAGCAKPAPSGGSQTQAVHPTTPATDSVFSETLVAGLPTARAPGAPYSPPPPTLRAPCPPLRADCEQYMVQWGDSLGYIASLYNLELEDVIAANDLVNPDALEIGQIINIPAPQPSTARPISRLSPIPSWFMVRRAPRLTLRSLLRARMVTSLITARRSVKRL